MCILHLHIFSLADFKRQEDTKESSSQVGMSIWPLKESKRP